MHPVLSDIAVANIESRTRALLESRQRIDLARQGSSRRPAMWKRITLLANVVHRVFDPRGHALRELSASPESRAKPTISPARNGSCNGAEMRLVEDISGHTAGAPARPITTIPAEGKVA